MITFLLGSIFGLWLGIGLVWQFVEQGIRDGYELCLSDTSKLTWRLMAKDGDK